MDDGEWQLHVEGVGVTTVLSSDSAERPVHGGPPARA
jgi:hypothetical protein